MARNVNEDLMSHRPTVYIIIIRPGAHYEFFCCMYPLYELLYDVMYWTVEARF